eukprot:2709391-Ditylum_brightwellii.AAC.1
MRQKTPSRESKSCNGGNWSWSSQTAHFSLRLTQGEGDGSCNAVNQSRSSQTAHSALCLSHMKGDNSFNGGIQS